MRFLHTADWHVGKTLQGRSRLDEQEQVAAEIVDIARRERIDCVLLAGDIFDSPAPTADAQRVVCDALAEIAGAGMAAVIVGGNHDHRRLAALRSPWRKALRNSTPRAARWRWNRSSWTKVSPLSMRRARAGWRMHCRCYRAASG